jgi:hypothetical protein
MVAPVERMLELNKLVAAAFRPPQEHVRLKADATPELDRLEREIAATDTEIDELAYKLYGITDEGRTIIENTERSARRPVPGVLSRVLGTNDARLWQGA